MSGLGKWFSIMISAGGSAYHPILQAVLDKATALGAGYEHPDEANLAILNTAVGDLDDIGFFDTYADVARFYAHNGGDSFSLINYVNPDAHLATISGSPVRSATLGYTSGNGASHINDNFNPSTQAVKMLVGNASFGYYKTDGQSISTPNGNIQDASDINRLQPYRITNQGYQKINGSSVLTIGTQTDNGNHLWTSQYDDTLANPRRVYKGSTQVGATIHGGTPALANAAQRNCFAGNDKSAFVFYGKSTIDILADLETIIETYLTALAAL